MPTIPITRWLLSLCLTALVAPVARGQSLAKVTPREAGLSSTALEKIDALLEQAVERKQVAGTVALLARDGKLGYLQAKGFQDVEAGKKMTTDSLFRIASMSKPVTSVAVMILVDDGKLKVTDPVSKYLPEFKNQKVLMVESGGDSKLVPATREMTIHDLLTHTSGLTYRFMAQKPFDELYRKADICDGLIRPSFTMAENVRHLASVPLLHQPGSAFQYGMSTDVLGRLVEVVSGQDLETFMRNRIFEPLAMNDTYFDLPADKTGRLAAVYEIGEDNLIHRLGEEPVTKGELAYCVTSPYEGQRGYCSGGAGLTSSAADFARFLQMLLNGGELNGARILKAETVRAMTTNQIGDFEFLAPTMRFGYGFGIWTDAGKDQPATAGSYGWGGFYGTGFWVDPEKKLVGVFMTQLRTDQPTIYEEFMKLAYAAIQSPEQDQQNKSPPESRTPLSVQKRENQLPDYRGWTHVKSVLIGPKSKAFATDGGIHHVYANEQALAGLKAGKFQDGSVLIYDLLEVKEVDGMTVEATRRRTDVMVKDDANYRDTGGWEFRQFLGTDRRSAELSPKQRASCFECHNRQKDRGFVFSAFRE